MLTGENGILTNATNANSSSVYYSAEEQVRLAYMSVRSQIMTETVANASYDATSTQDPDNVTVLANIVKSDLNASDTETGVTNGFIVTTDTSNEETPIIKITYKDSKITAGTISNAKPRTNGQVTYNIKLEKQNAKLETEDSMIIGINYGTKTAKTIDVGDDLSIGTEWFRVLSKSSTQIVAVPHYNITKDASNPVQTTTYDPTTITKFTELPEDKYWDTGEDDIDWTNDKCLLKPYVKAYSEKLNLATGNTGKVYARLGKRSEFLDTAINIPDGSSLTANDIRNPKKTGEFWLGSGYTSYATHVCKVATDGGVGAHYYYASSSRGVRPVLVIDLS